MSIRVTVITQNDILYIPYFMESFFSNKSENVDIDNIVILPQNKKSFFEFISKIHEFFGTFNMIRKGWRMIINKTKDKLKIEACSVESIAKKHDVKTYHLSSVNTSKFIDTIEKRDIDVILSVSSPEIFDSRVLIAPKWGCINVHTAKLPKYRGLLPTFWALYHGDEDIGVTVHIMDEKVDKGKIILQRTFGVKKNDSLDDVIKKGKTIGGRLAMEALDLIEKGEVKLKDMKGESSYFSFPTKKHRKEFEKQGGKLL